VRDLGEVTGYVLDGVRGVPRPGVLVLAHALRIRHETADSLSPSKALCPGLASLLSRAPQRRFWASSGL
jgi:hypothetical protein